MIYICICECICSNENNKQTNIQAYIHSHTHPDICIHRTTHITDLFLENGYCFYHSVNDRYWYNEGETQQTMDYSVFPKVLI